MNGRADWGVKTTLIVANLTKLVGLGVAVKSVFFAPSIRPLAVLLVMLLILGAQGVEELFVTFLRQLFGVDVGGANEKRGGAKSRKRGRS